jgi:peptidylprolyl isomerase
MDLKTVQDKYPNKQIIKTPKGGFYFVTKSGDGQSPKPNQTVNTHYTGTLFTNDKKFDSSRDRGKLFSFRAGAGQVIGGWDEAVLSMKVGERRTIILPHHLAYGQRGIPGVIPPSATLVFDMELVSLN